MPSCRLIHLTLRVLALGVPPSVEAQGTGGWPLHGLVSLPFSGVAARGRGVFAAFDSDRGTRRWSYQCEAGVNAPPITYAAGGRQIVAVAVGGNALFGFTQGDMVLAFALRDETR